MNWSIWTVQYQLFYFCFLSTFSHSFLIISLKTRWFSPKDQPHNRMIQCYIRAKVSSHKPVCLTICDSHGGEEGIKGLLPQDLASDWVLHHPSLKLGQLKHLIFVLVAQLEHLGHHLSQIQIILLSFSNLNEDRHQLVELVQGDDLISILVKEVEDSSQIVLHLARAEQVEENQHVCH